MKTKIILISLLISFSWASKAQEKPNQELRDMIKTDATTLAYKGEIIKQKPETKTIPSIRTDEASLAYKGEIPKAPSLGKNSFAGKIVVKVRQKPNKQ